MQQTKDQCFEQSYLSNLPIEGSTLDYGQFLELCITKQPFGLGLHFKMGEADKLFNHMDKNQTGKISLDDWISHFACRQVREMCINEFRIYKIDTIQDCLIA
jgi:Ca2+-binding EF-hand superfamily protein